MSAATTGTNINRTIFSQRLGELQVELDRLAERDLNDRARARVEGEIKASMRELRDEFGRKNAGLVREAERAVAALTPGAVRRNAIFNRPERYAALLSALATVADTDLPGYAELAAGEPAAVAAVRSVMSDRKKVAPEIRRAVDAALGDGITADLEHAVRALVVAKSETAAMLGEFSITEAAGPDAGTQALTAARAARSVDIDGHAHRFGDSEVVEAYEAMGLPRPVAEWPKPSPGGIQVPTGSVAFNTGAAS